MSGSTRQEPTRGTTEGITMPAPRMQPSGMIEVTTTSRLDGRISVYGYGQDDRIPNAGDLLLVCSNDLKENAKNQAIEIALRIRGRDMELLARAVADALMLWNDNKHWLQAPMSGPAVDSRAMTVIRSADNQKSLAAYLRSASA
jgi:hypothetical protein